MQEPEKTSQPIALMPPELSMLIAWHRARESDSAKSKQYRAAEYHMRRANQLEAAKQPLPVVEAVATPELAQDTAPAAAPENLDGVGHA